MSPRAAFLNVKADSPNYFFNESLIIVTYLNLSSFMCAEKKKLQFNLRPGSPFDSLFLFNKKTYKSLENLYKTKNLVKPHLGASRLNKNTLC